MSSLFIYRSPKFHYNGRFAGFDLDGTIVDTSSGNKFPREASDWMFIGDRYRKLAELTREDWSVVIITNQAYKNRQMALDRLTLIIKELKFEFILIAALEKDKYRKPHSTILDEYFPKRSDDSFYVGDAAGRPKDHSNTDRLFAINGNLEFFTPEQYFDHRKEKLPPLPERPWLINETGQIEEPIRSKTQEVVIAIGAPGSGKSSYLQRNYPDWVSPKKNRPEYRIVSQDIEGTKAKTVRLMKEYLGAGYSVVVDNTNPDQASREPYLKAAEQYDVPVHYLYFNLDPALSRHLNFYRESKGDKRVPEVAYRVFEKKLSLPEKYQEIEFVPSFESEQDRRLYEQYSD